MGLLPDGDRRTEISGPNITESGISLRQAIRGRPFWTICFANIAIVSCLMVIMLHIVPHTTDLGLSAATAAGILATIGGISMAGRLGIGIAIDRVGTRTCILVCFILFVSAFLCIQLAKERWMLILFALVYGFGHGGYFTLLSPRCRAFRNPLPRSPVRYCRVCRHCRRWYRADSCGTSLTSPEAIARLLDLHCRDHPRIRASVSPAKTPAREVPRYRRVIGKGKNANVKSPLAGFRSWFDTCLPDGRQASTNGNQILTPM
jgi:chromate transport protein ChrA